jgi:hypothetical protein
MKDDLLLRALGKVAAEQSAERARWEASGSKGAIEDPSNDVADERAELAKRLFAPASAASVEAIAASVVGSLGAAGGQAARVVPMRGRAWRWAGLVGTPLAAAAAIALLVTRPRAPLSDLPEYTVSVSGGVRADRGADTRGPSEPVAVAAGTEVVLVARPEASAAGSVHAATFVVGSGAPIAVASTSETSAKGAVRVTVRGDDLAKVAGAGGSIALVLVVDRSEGDDRRALAAGDGATREWTRFTVPVRVSGQGH